MTKEEVLSKGKKKDITFTTRRQNHKTYTETERINENDVDGLHCGKIRREILCLEEY